MIHGPSNVKIAVNVDSYITNVTVFMGTNMKYAHKFDKDFFKIAFGMRLVLQS